MLSSSASRFNSMPIHPPTPPKEVSKAVDDAISFLEDGHEIQRALSKSLVERRPSLQAAVPSPATSQESAGAYTSKKVGFSPHAVFHQLSGQHPLSSPARRSPKRSPSKKNAKPLKSILKSTQTRSAPPTPDDLDSKLSHFSPDVPGSFAKMLQSVLSQLGSQSISDRLDAYLTLNGTLQTYNDVPDAAGLTQKLGLLTQFLSRDIAWKTTDGKLDQNIVMQALKLTNCLLLHETTSAALDLDFKCFLVDRSIVVMESPDTPKQVVKAHVHLLAQPKIQAPALNASRADKALNALQTIEQRCSGNHIISTRLVVYQRLLEQAPTLMLTRVRDWLEQTFHCMLSSINDIRGRAIDTCMKGGIKVGAQSLAAKGLSEFLDTEISDGQSYFEFFNAKLLEMLSDKELAPCVPRIWSAVVLYFRSKKTPLERWTRFRQWLAIMQKCWNSSDIAVRYEATLAWNKLIFTTTFDLSLSPGMMKMLKTPIVSGIEKRGQDTFSRQIRQYTLDCYCNLLHYGLRPSLTAEELEAAWQAFVEPILSPMMRASQKGRITASRVLCGLISGNDGAWNPNAALIAAPIKPEDLPRLDPRWVRSHIGEILGVLHPAVQTWLWTATESNAALNTTWTALMQAVSDAGAQEVKTSNDLKQAIALLVSFFRKVWTSASHLPSDNNSGTWLKNYVSWIETTISKLGPGHFVEAYLTASKDDAIEVAPTPSMKRSKGQAVQQSPMVLLLVPLFNPSTSEALSQLAASSLVQSLLSLFVAGRPSSLAKMELLSRTFFALRTTMPSAEAPVVENNQLFGAIAKSMISVLDAEKADSHQQGSHGHYLRLAVDVLTAELTMAPSLELSQSLLPLYDGIYRLAKRVAGEGAIVLSVMEPTSKALLTALPSLQMQIKARMANHIASKAVWPRSKQVIEEARKSLWGVGLAPHKAGLFDPFDHVYAMFVEAMTSAYLHYAADSANDLNSERSLFSAVVTFLEHAPISLLPTALRRTQEGFVAWVQDAERKTGSQDGLTSQIVATWTKLLQLMTSIPSTDSNLLKTLEPLMVAGFASPHKQIVSETIVFWNANFGKQQSLDYPAMLEGVLRARIEDADVELPTFPESNVDRLPATLPKFFEEESQKSNVVPATNQEPLTESNSSQHISAKELLPAKGYAVPNTAGRRSSASGSATPKARLRHDDSQIHFAPIDSSPLHFDNDSQHLTEHQNEVKARQNEAAQMFPELSSSPIAQSTALPRPLSKRLDFSESRIVEEDAFGTPSALPDAAGIMSDDMPSSPTPSSTKDAGQPAVDSDDDQATEDELDDPSSSPPRISFSKDNIASGPPVAMSDHAAVDDTTMGISVYPLQNQEAAATDNEVMAPSRQRTKRHGEDVDLASDTILPAEQLQLEAEAAQTASQAMKENNNPSGGRDSAQSEVADDGGNDVTRVEDSFVGITQPQSRVEENVVDSPGSRRSSRKRKRTSPVDYAAKKQKSASPLKRIISRIWPSSQQETDDDVGEEIVVASSQLSQSPASPREPESMVLPSHLIDEPITDPQETKQEAMAAPPKRRPGRPGKSATPTPSLSQSNEDASQTRSLKRKASVSSNVSVAGEEASTSFIKDTPAVPKSRKGRQGQTASQGSEKSSSRRISQTERITRRTATTVMVPPPHIDAEDEADPIEIDSRAGAEASTPQKADQQHPDAAAVDERPKLTPRSILGRLRDALSDFVGMTINPTETREFDDVLFEIRREVHEADRRGRAEGGQ